jgi:hypothetical protein
MEFHIVYFSNGTLRFSTFMDWDCTSLSEMWYLSVRYLAEAEVYQVWGTETGSIALCRWSEAEAYIEEHVNAKIISLQSAQKQE